MRSPLHISASMLVAFVAAVSVQAFQRDTTARWQKITSGAEFSVMMPAGSNGYVDDREYTTGTDRIRVSKRTFYYRNINGAVLLSEVIEGDVKAYQKEMMSRLHTASPGYDLVKTQTFDKVSVHILTKKSERLFSIQQLVLFKDRLYILQGHAADENNPIVAQYFRSLTIDPGKKAIMPNISTGKDLKSIVDPPDIVLSDANSVDLNPISGKADRDAIILHRARPRFSDAFRRAGTTGTIVLNVLFSAAGKVEKVEYRSGVFALSDGATEAARNILFIPAEKDGRPVSVWKQVSYTYSIY